MSLYKGSAAQGRIAREARKGKHFAAHAAKMPAPVFKIGDKVKVKKTGMKDTILDKTSWGDYELKELRHKFFSPESLELDCEESSE